MASNNGVQVIVRLRPLNPKEQAEGTLPVVTSSTQNKEVTLIRGTGKAQVRSTFKYDAVFGSYATQSEIFDRVLAGEGSVISDVMKGFESTVFAYGQTGTGKTHTMEGNLNSPDLMGIIPRAAIAIFKQLGNKRYVSHRVTVSYLEIYNEQLCDLLALPALDNKGGTGEVTKLQIVEDTKKGGRGVHCMGLSEHSVASAEDVLRVLHAAQERKQVGETKMNKVSSRSHCLFSLTVHSKENKADGFAMSRTGKLHLVDLAGSECAKSAGSESHAQERERKNINQSLLTLGRVIGALRDKQKNPSSNVRVPYRDSKLTRLLQDSLGGRCKTCMFATVSPSVLCSDETLQTLSYAQRANGIKNKPICSSRMGKMSGKSASEVDPHLEANFHAMEMRCTYMASQLEEAQSALARSHEAHHAQEQRAEKAEEQVEQLGEELSCTQKELEETKATLMENQAELTQTQEHLTTTKTELAETIDSLNITRAKLEATQSEIATVRSGVSKFCQIRAEKTVTVHKMVLKAAEQGKTSVAELCAAIESMHGSIEQAEEGLGGWAATAQEHSKSVHNKLAELQESHSASLHSAKEHLQQMIADEQTTLISLKDGLGSLLVNIEAQSEAEATQIETVNSARSLVQEATTGQLALLSQQKTAAEEQHAAVDAAKTAQEECRRALVSTVMAGVESLLAQEVEKLGEQMIQHMLPISTANSTLQTVSESTTNSIVAMAEELAGVHEVAVEAAKIWGDSGRSAAASIRKLDATSDTCTQHSQETSKLLDSRVEGLLRQVATTQDLTAAGSQQWATQFDSQQELITRMLADGTKAHHTTREQVMHQQRKLHNFQVQNDADAQEALREICSHNEAAGSRDHSRLAFQIIDTATPEVDLRKLELPTEPVAGDVIESEKRHAKAKQQEHTTGEGAPQCAELEVDMTAAVEHQAEDQDAGEADKNEPEQAASVDLQTTAVEMKVDTEVDLGRDGGQCVADTSEDDKNSTPQANVTIHDTASTETEEMEEQSYEMTMEFSEMAHAVTNGESDTTGEKENAQEDNPFVPRKTKSQRGKKASNKTRTVPERRSTRRRGAMMPKVNEAC